MTRPPSRLRKNLPLLAALLTLALTCADAYARAGGGGGYHSSGGGGGSHSSSGGGGGGGGGGIWTLINIVIFCFEHPLIAVILVVAFILYVKFGGDDKKGAARKPVAQQERPARDRALATLAQHDPAFSEEAFLARVNTAFDKIQAAWCAQDLRTVRPFVSDGVHERFTLQFQEQQAEGYRDHMDAIRVTRAAIVALSSPGVFDEVAVRIDAEARDWRQSLADGSRISGSNAVEPFTEIWTFLRRRGALTDRSKTGLIEGNCPNCGAPIELNQSANCTNCNALLRSGTFDWVLTEITQESEWRLRAAAGLVGVRKLAARDPDFDVAALEDRASVVYWRKATADRVGKVDALRKVALPEFADAYATSLRGPKGGRRPFVADSAVGSVETVGVLSDDQWDHALVEVRWSGHWFTTDPATGRLIPAGGEVSAHTLYVLARQASARSNAAKSISSAHCPNCGAPESTSASNACESCGTVLNDGSFGWVLEDVCERESPQGISWMQRLRA